MEVNEKTVFCIDLYWWVFDLVTRFGTDWIKNEVYYVKQCYLWYENARLLANE